MDIKELLKAQGLEEDAIKKILEEMEKNKLYITNLEKADERYEKLKKDKEGLEEQLKTATTTLEELKGASGNKEELEKKIKEYEDNLKKIEEKNKEDIKNLTLENELIKVNVNSVKATKAELDMTKIIYNEKDKTFVGLSDQLEKMKEEKAWLFKDVETPSESKKKKKYDPNKGGGVKGDLATLMKDKDFNLTEYLKEGGKI